MKSVIFILAVMFSVVSCEKEEVEPNNSNTTSTTYNSGSSGGSSGCSTVQCTAYTQAGDRCTRMTTNCSGRCWQHD